MDTLAIKIRMAGTQSRILATTYGEGVVFFDFDKQVIGQIDSTSLEVDEIRDHLNAGNFNLPLGEARKLAPELMRKAHDKWGPVCQAA